MGADKNDPSFSDTSFDVIWRYVRRDPGIWNQDKTILLNAKQVVYVEDIEIKDGERSDANTELALVHLSNGEDIHVAQSEIYELLKRRGGR